MKKKILSVFLIAVMLVTLMPCSAFGAIKSAGTATNTSSLVSSENLEHNFVKVTANGSSLYVEVETPIKASEFNVSVVKTGQKKSSWVCRVYPENMGGYYSFDFTVPLYVAKAGGNLSGDYILMITMKKPGSSKSIVCYKNCAFNVRSGKFSILKYSKVINENNRIEKKGAKVKASNFKKTNMSDLKTLLFRDPVTKKVASVTKSKVKYFKKTADSVTKGAKTDYEKVLKIYEYIGTNFYYDTVAFSTGTKQYIDPYRNLYNMRNKKKSANSQSGKVATTCVGYSAAVVALCRAEGIPARIVNGHHISLGDGGFNNWSTETGITKLDHWWAEVYVDGRWIIVDATPANSNKWNRNTNKWEYTGLTNYVYFDPTPEQFATSHLIFQIRGVN